MEEFKRKQREKRRREKEESRQKRLAKVTADTAWEPVVATLNRKLAPLQEAKHSELDIIQKYGFRGKSKVSTPIKTNTVLALHENRKAHFTMSKEASPQAPRRSVQFNPSPGSTISDLTWSQSSPVKQLLTAKKAVQTSLNFQCVNFDDDSSDEDLLRLADVFARKRKAAACAAGLTTPSAVQSARADSEDSSQRINTKPTARPSDSSEDEDLVKSAEKMGMKHRANQAPHNPLTLDRRVEENFNLSSSKEQQSGATPTGRKNAVAEAALWSDSDEDTIPVTKATRKARNLSMESRRKLTPTKAQSGSKITSSTQLAGRKMKRVQSSIELPEIPEAVDLEDMLKPEFAKPKLGPPSALVPLTLVHSEGEHQVPASINRYLMEYQRAGVRFIHRRIAEGKGCILGDDMGLGKTVQVISMLAAMFAKSGTGKDLVTLNERRRKLSAQMVALRNQQNRALRNGTLSAVRTFEPEWPENIPVLVMVPSSVTQNWMNEFDAWGHFGVALYHGGDRALSLERIRNGLDEVLICSKGVLVSADDMASLKSIPWKLIVVDEQHQQKNRKSAGFQALESLRETCQCPVLGMTGTVMQNNLEELWACVETVEPGFLETWESFKSEFATPIMLARTKTATDDIVRRGNAVRHRLTEKLKVLYIKRNKSQVLTDELPMKNERVLFCEPSPIQKELYERMLLLPDFILLKYAQAPCECGVNRALFQQFKLLRNEREKLDFQRRKRGEIQKKWKCCWKMPMNPNYDPATCDPDEICDPRAPLWKWQHRSNSGECCKTCPFCLLFPALTKILKLSSHPSLLQLDRPPESYPENSVDWQNAMKDLEFAKVAIPDEMLRQLPGGDYVRQDGIMDQHTQLSGKMKVLAKLLKEFSRRDDRLLLFSYSTQMLDLIQNFVRSEGYSFLRLDGKTANKNRQALVDQYQADNKIFLFLISTKAGGLGLNLTAANVVIIFDVEYNPSNDEQAQDRAYRIGQMRDVLVIRLVTRGTIEELKYIRQIYKVQLKQDTIGDIEEGENKKAARMFRAVQGDKDRKGELFGIENLLRYKDGSFMDDLWKSSAVDQAKPDKKTDLDERLGLVSAEEVVQGIRNLDEDEIDDIGRKPDEWLAAHALRKDPFAYSGNEDDVARMLADRAVNHADFLQKEKGHAALEVGDVGFDEEQGGYSQVVNDVLAYAGDDGSDSDVGVAETHDTEHPSPVRSTALRQSPAAVLSSAHALFRKARTTNPPVTARPSPAKRPRVDLPSPVRSFGASVYIVAPDPIEEDAEEEVAPTPRNKFSPAPKHQLDLVIEKHTSASTQTSAAAPDNGDTLDNDRAVADLQRTMHNEANGNHVPRRKFGEKSASAKVSSQVAPKPASKPQFSSKTTFSAGDLFLPSYSKKHKKSSKKS